MTLPWKPTRFSRKQQEERRLFAEALIREGKLIPQQIAELCGVTDSSVRRWRLRLRHGQSLEATVAPGPAQLLSDELIAQTIDFLRAGPDPALYEDQRWTCPRFRNLIGLKFGVWYDVDHLSRLLHE